VFKLPLAFDMDLPIEMGVAVIRNCSGTSITPRPDSCPSRENRERHQAGTFCLWLTVAAIMRQRSRQNPLSL